MLGAAGYVELATGDILHHDELDNGAVRVFVAPCTEIRRVFVHEVCARAGDLDDPELFRNPAASCSETPDETPHRG